MDSRKSTYSKEEKKAFINAWLAEYLETGINATDYAKKNNIPVKVFFGWVRRKGGVRELCISARSSAEGNKDHLQSSIAAFVKVNPVEFKEPEACSLLLEYCGAKIAINDENTMKMVLTTLKELSFT